MGDYRLAFNEHGATDCPKCGCVDRRRILDSFTCPACNDNEPISANNGSVRTVESLQPIGAAP